MHGPFTLHSVLSEQIIQRRFITCGQGHLFRACACRFQASRDNREGSSRIAERGHKVLSGIHQSLESGAFVDKAVHQPGEPMVPRLDLPESIQNRRLQLRQLRRISRDAELSEIVRRPFNAIQNWLQSGSAARDLICGCLEFVGDDYKRVALDTKMTGLEAGIHPDEDDIDDRIGKPANRLAKFSPTCAVGGQFW